MLNFIWGEYESYCKQQSNELRAQYDILKKLTQGSLPADDWMTNSNHSSTFAINKPEMEEVLLRDLFLFGLQDESFMSKIISEESQDVTITQLQNKLKCLEASRATAKYIKSGDAKEVHQIKKTKKQRKQGSRQGIKPQNDFGKNNQGQKNNNWQQSQGKHKQPPSETAMPAPRKQFHGHGQQTKKIDPSTCMRVWRYKALTRLLMPCSKIYMQSLQ